MIVYLRKKKTTFLRQEIKIKKNKTKYLYFYKELTDYHIIIFLKKLKKQPPYFLFI